MQYGYAVEKYCRVDETVKRKAALIQLAGKDQVTESESVLGRGSWTATGSIYRELQRSSCRSPSDQPLFTSLSKKTALPPRALDSFYSQILLRMRTSDFKMAARGDDGYE